MLVALLSRIFFRRNRGHQQPYVSETKRPRVSIVQKRSAALLAGQASRATCFDRCLPFCNPFKKKHRFRDLSCGWSLQVWLFLWLIAAQNYADYDLMAPSPQGWRCFENTVVSIEAWTIGRPRPPYQKFWLADHRASLVEAASRKPLLPLIPFMPWQVRKPQGGVHGLFAPHD
jgi:hypothetical protein